MSESTAYNPKSVEADLYRRWEASGYFNPDRLPGRRTRTFSISMPPPNVTGDLHIGHALTITLEDLMIRHARMCGAAALWVPGTDHAGIATQIKVERMLEETGTSRHEIGRDAFLRHVWQWKERYGDTITKQIRAMGASCDWSRERFTMDFGLTEAVHEAFVRLFNDGLVYRAKRLINWCPNDRTALSDLEVRHEERAGSLWYLRYRIKKSSHVVVATTRPETMLGDTAVAVNPKDRRYRSLVGKTAIVPIVNREVPIVADARVERDFGTGAVKITPAHDALDAAIGKTHGLPAIQVIGPTGKMTRKAGRDFEGIPIHEARTLLVEALDREGLLEKTEDYRHNVAICDRCGTAIEPQLSDQWFIRMAPLAKRAIAAVKSGKIRILPKRFEKVYFHWLNSIQDWTVSRQLWWGHRIPIWYCNACDGFVASAGRPKRACPHCRKRRGFTQEEDVLDTWFSSGLWTFSTLGWPRNQRGKTKRGDLRRFHPTAVMETGWDILFFWVARMVMLSLYLTGEVPFRTVYLNGLILDEHGKKMSKSRGTGVDPLVMTERYGTDAIRLALVIGQSAGQDFRMSEAKIAGMRNFVNKLWNIGRYVADQSAPTARRRPPSPVDRWVVSRLANVTREVDAAIARFDFSAAGQLLIDFTWHELADWYLEAHKVERNDRVLREVYETLLRLLHPFAPFVTEQLWQQLVPRGRREFLMLARWPKPGRRSPAAERRFAEFQRTVIALRNFRAHSGLRSDEPGHIAGANHGATWRTLYERLGRVSLSGDGTGRRIGLGYTSFHFPSQRVRAYESWRRRERASLTTYLKRLDTQLANPKLPDHIRRQIETRRADALRRQKAL